MMAKIFARYMLFETLRANVFLYFKRKTNLLFFFFNTKKRKDSHIQRFLMKKVNHSFSQKIFHIGRPLKYDRFWFARMPILFVVGGHFYFHFHSLSPTPPPFSEWCLENVFLHVFARNSNQELMKASIAAGKNH